MPSKWTQSHVAIVIGMMKNHFTMFVDAVSCALLGIYIFQKFSPSLLFLLLKSKLKFGQFILFINKIPKDYYLQLELADGRTLPGSLNMPKTFSTLSFNDCGFIGQID